MLALAKRFPQLSFGLVQTILFVAILALGFTMGGPVGLGTLILVFLMHFDPRSITHQNFIKITAVLFTNKA